MKKLIISLTSKDFSWEFMRGSGPGGQKKNKTNSACRCTHIPSKAVGYCQESRSQLQNKQEAFRKMSETKEFQNWLKVEIAKKSGTFISLEEQVDEMMQEKNLKIEYFENKEITCQDQKKIQTKQ